MVLCHPSCDQCLGKPGGKPASPVHPKPSRTLPQGKVMLIHGNPKRLIVQIQRIGVKVVSDQLMAGCRLPRILRRLHFLFRHVRSILQNQPVILPPAHLLDGRLPSDHVAAASRKAFCVLRIAILTGPRAQMDGVPFALLCLHQVAVAALLQQKLLVMPAGQDRISLIIALSLHEIRPEHFVGAPYALCAQNGLSVGLPGSRVRRKQIVPVFPLKDVRPFQKDFIRLVDVPYRTCHLLFFRIKLLQQETSRILFGNTVVRHHADHVLASVLIMEQRRVKAKIVEGHRLRPGAVNVIRRHQIVFRVVHIAVKSFHNRVHQIKGSLIVGKTGRPDSLGGSNAPQIQLGHAV